MALTKRKRAELAGKTIDAHTHLGVSLKAYALGEHPFAQSAEGLAYRLKACDVDLAVVFPFTADLYFDPLALREGNAVPAQSPASPAPYAAENRLVMREVFEFCPEHSDRFLTFVSMDPGRAVEAQLRELNELEKCYPIYGIKINPVICQSRALELLDGGAALLDWAEERGLPLLFHVSTLADEYSHAEDVFKVVESRPGLRFCLAHCLLYHEEYLKRAVAAPNIWVDTAAMKIQVEMVRELVGNGEIARETLIDADYSDHLAVMRTLCERFADTIIWGSDAPCYSYICRRKQGEGQFREFNYKATYEDEVAALNALSPELRAKVGRGNALDFIFGPES